MTDERRSALAAETIDDFGPCRPALRRSGGVLALRDVARFVAEPRDKCGRDDADVIDARIVLFVG